MITWEMIEAKLPKHVTLVYVDHQSNFDNSPDALQRAIREGNLCPLDEEIEEWCSDAEHEGIAEIVEKLKSDLAEEHDEPDVERALDEFEDRIRDELFNRDSSDVISSMLRYTDNPVMFYDTGYEMESDSWSWSPARVRLERIKIKKHLGLVTGWNDKQLDSLICHASYGGQLVIYFRDDIENLLIPEEGKDYTSIEFDQMCLAIIDTHGGSGFDVGCAGPVKFKFNREKIFVDKTIKYNYTYAVCGMYSSWCESTTVKLGFEELPEHPDNSTLEIEVRRDRHYTEVFKAGKCSFGDMDIRRHRRVHYENDFPCGQRCKDCGTFWID